MSTGTGRVGGCSGGKENTLNVRGQCTQYPSRTMYTCTFVHTYVSAALVNIVTVCMYTCTYCMYFCISKHITKLHCSCAYVQGSRVTCTYVHTYIRTYVCTCIHHVYTGSTDGATFVHYTVWGLISPSFPCPLGEISTGQ